MRDMVMNERDLCSPNHSLRDQKPGWLSRIFGIESAVLVACDANWRDEEWVRPAEFRFLYRSRRGGFFLMTTPRSWREVEGSEARKLFEGLPEQIVADLDDGAYASD